MRKLAVVVAMAVVLGGLGLHEWSGGVPPVAAAQDEAASVDDRATRLRKRLGSLCRNFDFYFRHEFANGEMRPVRCSRINREKTVLVIYAFSNRRTKQAWLSEWGRLADERGAAVVRGKRWAVEVLVNRWEREVRERLEG